MKVLILTDNKFLLENFNKIIQSKNLSKKYDFTYAYSFNNPAPNDLIDSCKEIVKMNVKNEMNYIIKNFDLIFSLHCKQIFPKELVNKVRCINIHPGFNPYNRGWFPQVFSIINKYPIGATIHLMDEQIDHGPIICQKEISIDPADTSQKLYNKILKAEIELLNENIENLILGTYKTFEPSYDGNYNSKKDFERLCEINLNEKLTFGQAIDRLRALTHDNFNNAYFTDSMGNKIFIKIILDREHNG